MSAPDAKTRETAARKDFLREKVGGGRGQRPLRTPHSHPFSARAQRLPSHRARQVDLPQLRRRQRVRRAVQPPLRRHQPDHRRHQATSRRPERRPVAGLRLGRGALRERLLREAVRDRGAAGRAGKAYVDSQSEEEIREPRGTVTVARYDEPRPRPHGGGESRPAAPDAGGRVPRRRLVLRAKDRHGAHQHAHARSAAPPDPHGPITGGATLVHLPALRLRPRAVRAIEGITHSLCTLEFKDNNDIYDWLVREAGFEQPPEQTEFARLELDYTVVSKRKLLRLVNEEHVSGWDDPRMPTIAGLRRRGVTPEAIRDFADTIGVARRTRAPSSRARARGAQRPEHAGAPRDGRDQAAQGGPDELPGKLVETLTRRSNRTTYR